MALQNNMEFLSKLLDEMSENKVKWLKVSDDPNESTDIRLLPINEKTVCADYQHWGIIERPVPCLKTWGEKCPICEKLWATGKLPADAFKKKSRMLPTKRILMWVLKVIGRGEETKVEDTPYIFSTNDGFLNYIYKFCMPKGINLIDPDKGQIVSLSRKAGGKQIEKAPLGVFPINNILDKIEEKLVPWEEVLRKPDEEFLKDVLKKLDEKLQKIIGVTSQVDNVGGKNNDDNVGGKNNDDNVGGKNNDDNVGGKNNVSLIDTKREQIFQQTGLKIQKDEIVKCFGLYNTKNDCNFCEFAIACEEYSKEAKGGVEELDDVPF